MMMTILRTPPLGAQIRGERSPSSSLADLTPGARAVVCSVQGEQCQRRRMMEMGFVSGTPVRVVRFAPLGDPMQVELHGYHISLRRAEARAILVDPA